MRAPLNEAERTHASCACDVLTKRQREVMLLAAAGLSNKAIALEFNISEGTIKLHLHEVYQKLGIRGRTELAALVNKDT